MCKLFFNNRILLFVLSAALFACSEDSTTIDNGDDGNDNNIDETYAAPDYADDYSAISSWDNRASWNLANVHDPSVAYDNGYYYMYTTDASYVMRMKHHRGII
ncbi:MAG: hypothetical protein ACK5MI_08905 [Mangrovibacterium sp.]